MLKLEFKTFTQIYLTNFLFVYYIMDAPPSGSDNDDDDDDECQTKSFSILAHNQAIYSSGYY